MDITVTGRKIQVTDALRENVEQKIGDALRVFDISPMTADVVLRVEHYKNSPEGDICEVTVRVRGSVIRVSCAKDDMYAAIDEAAHMLTRRMRKLKTRVVDRRQRASKSMGGETIQENTQLEAQVLADEDDEALVREKFIEYTKLTEEDALVQADLLGHDFFVFRDMVTDNVHVIYHRKNGGYGILKPDTERR